MRLATTQLPDRAEVSALAAEIASRLEGARAAVVFGSHARGSACARLSDVDVLVWVEDRLRARGARALAEEYSGADVSVLVHDSDSLGALAAGDWSFVCHLHREQIPAWGDVEGLRARLETPTPGVSVIREEIRGHGRLAAQLAEPRVLGGEHLHAYAGLFGALKSAAILDGILAGETVFDRHEAIAGAARRRPGLAPEFERLAGLEPFWLRLRRRAPVGLPWRPRHDRDRLADHLASATRVLDALGRPGE